MRPKVVFDPTKDLPLVKNFECGTDPWAIEVSNWIKSPATVLESAARMVTRKLVDKVWLFCEDDGALVGFTSLAKEKWDIEKPEGISSVPILHIPYLALSSQFQGKREPKSSRSYFRIIFEDLLYEAGRLTTLNRYRLGLHVQKANEKAIGLYRDYGFDVCGEEEIYYRMIVDAEAAVGRAGQVSQSKQIGEAPKPPPTTEAKPS